MQSNDLKTTAVVLGESGMFGIRTEATDAGASLGLIVLNAGMLPNVGPFRMHPELSLALGNTDVCVLRLDQSGKGESPTRAGLSPADAVLLDYDEAFAHLAACGVRETVVMGLCSGAVDALRIAAARKSVSGLVLLDGYVERTGRWRVVHLRKRLRAGIARVRRSLAVGPKDAQHQRNAEQRSGEGNDDAILADTRDWKLLDLRASYLDVLARDVKILSIFSGSFYPYNYAGQLRDFLSVGAMSAGLREVFFDDADHTYTVVTHRRRLIALIHSWLQEVFDV